MWHVAQFVECEKGKNLPKESKSRRQYCQSITSISPQQKQNKERAGLKTRQLSVPIGFLLLVSI